PCWPAWACIAGTKVAGCEPGGAACCPRSGYSRASAGPGPALRDHAARKGRTPMMNKLMACTAGLLLAGTASLAVAQVSPEDQIEFRKAGYSFMSWNMGKIKAQVVEGSVPYDQAQVAAAANAIAGIANSGM